MNPFTTSHTALPGLSIISAMITPAILILASGNLVASTISRLARVVDRARELRDRLEHSLERHDTESAAIYAGLLKMYPRRSVLVERALIAFYSAIVLFVASSLAIALGDVVANNVPWLAVTLTIIGVLLLLLGTLALVLETSSAAGLLRREVEAFDALRAQRRQSGI